MKKWILLMGIVALVLVGGFLALSFYGVRFIHAELRKVAGPGLTIADIQIRMTYLSMKGIQYEEPQSKRRLLQIEEVRIYPALLSAFKETLDIREWTFLKPSFFFYRTREGNWLGPWPPAEKAEEKTGEEGKEATATRGKKKEDAFQVRVRRLHVENGSVTLEDMKTGGKTAHITLRDLNLELKDFQYPIRSGQSPIDVTGKMEGKTKEGHIEVKGWIDLKTIDMETRLKAREIELILFEPYYERGVSAEMESGYMNLDGTIAVKNRTVDAPGQFELVDLRVKEEGTVFWIPAKTLVSLLKDRGNRIKIQFQVKGSLDDPKFSIQEALLTRIALSLAESLGLPVKVVGEEFLGGALKGAKGLAEGLKSVEELFKRKKEKRR